MQIYSKWRKRQQNISGFRPTIELIAAIISRWAKNRICYLWGFTPHTPWCFSMVIDYKGFLNAPADKKTMAHPAGAQALWAIPKPWWRVACPRSQLHPSHIGEGLVRVDVSFLLSLRQRKLNVVMIKRKKSLWKRNKNKNPAVKQ